MLCEIGDADLQAADKYMSGANYKRMPQLLGPV